MLDFLAGNPVTVITVLGGIVTALWSFAKSIDKVANWIKGFDGWLTKYSLSEAWQLCLEIADELYREEVRILKEEGEFDADAKRRMKEKAILIFKERAGAFGSIAKKYVPALIEAAISYLKGDKSVAPFLPELQPELE